MKAWNRWERPSPQGRLAISSHTVVPSPGEGRKRLLPGGGRQQCDGRLPQGM
eukprot:CAMPEP_0113965980 /NCGR_PEP_ID=MMETSP0011_2-20120614/8065_1 /TAXON_ID=101924 /ORGANISM="Rhodosorus marinus" /LENGTH=51 /DNA_ID=CAMNT_0000978591 /DNA_START=152 /DNA_END=307 /DNA_ORIENTATION=+ /assembly_acc=CAM_ASM_000156